jgi:hypothetical protein
MQATRYFAEDTPDAFERERLALLTGLADPITTPRQTGGALAEADFDELEEASDDPSFHFVAFTVFGAWGRRAS